MCQLLVRSPPPPDCTLKTLLKTQTLFQCQIFLGSHFRGDTLIQHPERLYGVLIVVKLVNKLLSHPDLRL